MLSVLLFAPLLLVAPASAAPRLQKDDVAVAYSVVTVTSTATVCPESTPHGAAPLAFSEKYSPAATQSALASPPSPNTASPQTETQGNSRPRGAYNNALYFTNWYVFTSPCM